MPKQVVVMAKAHGATITPRAAEELVSRAGENSRMLDNELKKLVEMVGTSIDLPDIERHIARTAEAKPWDLLNAMSARNMEKTLQLLALQPDKSEVRLYMLLVGRLRELIMAKALDRRGARAGAGGQARRPVLAGKKSSQLGTQLLYGRAASRSCARGRSRACP